MLIIIHRLHNIKNNFLFTYLLQFKIGIHGKTVIILLCIWYLFTDISIFYICVFIIDIDGTYHGFVNSCSLETIISQYRH